MRDEISDSITQMVSEMVRDDMRRIEDIAILVFGSAEGIERAVAEWPLILATGAWSSVPHVGRLRQWLTLEKQCLKHGGYSSLRPIETREDWDRERANFGVDECPVCRRH